MVTSPPSQAAPDTLPVFSLTLEPANPLKFPCSEFRADLIRQMTAGCSGAAEPNPQTQPGEKILYRYPPLLVRQIKENLIVTGICQGARFLSSLTSGSGTLVAGNQACRIISRDPEIRHEVFGIDGHPHAYEFLTPWLALNQQYAKKFYDLQGKPARDAFMEKILLTHLNTLAKSLDAPQALPVTCSARVKFRRERIDRENVIVFSGTFKTNLRIPEYFAIGQSVSLGYGTVREIAEPDTPASG